MVFKISSNPNILSFYDSITLPYQVGAQDSKKRIMVLGVMVS